MFGSLRKLRRTTSVKKKKSTQRRSTSNTKTNLYHCVEVKSFANACDAALEIKGKRFLSYEAPALPLVGCDVKCTCRYVHFNDRRQVDRRDTFSSNSSAIKNDKLKRNRRMGGDRRRNKTVRSGLN